MLRMPLEGDKAAVEGKKKSPYYLPSQVQLILVLYVWAAVLLVKTRL